MKICSMIGSVFTFQIFTIMLFLVVLSSYTSGAKVYLVEEDTLMEDHQREKATPTRLKRQVHPAATVAKLPTPDNSAFIPIVGPTQASQSPFFQNTESVRNTLELPRDTLIDYLVPPNPDSHISNLNFQDPAANLQNIENGFDNTPPSSSSSNNFASFRSFQNQFPPPPTFQNPINHPRVSTPQPALTNDQVRSVSFQTPLIPAPTPPLTQNVAPPAPPQQFLANKISTGKEPSNPPAQFANTFNQEQPDRSIRGRHQLGYDANEILAPPQEAPFARNGEYDTINTPKRRPNQASGPPGPQPQQVPTNQFAAPNQFQTPQFPSFNAFAPSGPNEQFAPANQLAPASNQVTGSQPFLKENFEDANNVVWGAQKQPLIGPTTNAPFLPTVPPTQQPNNFQNPAAFNQVQNQQQPFQQPFQQFQQQFQPPSNQLYHHLQGVNSNQNFALETPSIAQFDTFLPQGTVSDHTFPQHFRKRQVSSDEEEYEEPKEEPESRYRHRPGPVYSFVKTDRDGHFKWSVRHPSRR